MGAYFYWGMGRNLWGDEYPHPPGFAPLLPLAIFKFPVLKKVSVYIKIHSTAHTMQYFR